MMRFSPPFKMSWMRPWLERPIAAIAIAALAALVVAAVGAVAVVAVACGITVDDRQVEEVMKKGVQHETGRLKGVNTWEIYWITSKARFGPTSNNRSSGVEMP